MYNTITNNSIIYNKFLIINKHISLINNFVETFSI